ncbi:hypothetical protein NDU88_000745 [Pleurodeles waltl]|uniref:Uncharacterized protein n=1 Tax=Pleurodeles waltl TaxID=8319 RepID=A0AAV7R9M2_PLEWA|nr:hypothetical protein NDU88_000745 [Pleurodeles waltl]
MGGLEGKELTPVLSSVWAQRLRAVGQTRGAVEPGTGGPGAHTAWHQLRNAGIRASQGQCEGARGPHSRPVPARGGWQPRVTRPDEVPGKTPIGRNVLAESEGSIKIGPLSLMDFDYKPYDLVKVLRVIKTFVSLQPDLAPRCIV